MGTDILGFKNSAGNSLTVNNYYDYEYKGFNMAPHNHYGAELMYSAGGECEIYLYPSGNNKEYKKIKLKKGQFIFIFSEFKHRLYIPKDKTCKVFNLEFTPVHSAFNLKSLLDSDPALTGIFSSGLSYLVCNDSVDLKTTIKKLIDELSANYLNSKELYLQSLILELLILVCRCHTNTQSDSKYYIAKTMDFIKENYSHEITVKAISDFVGLNPVYLERLIKSNTGKTILNHINEFRLSQAKSLIENTTLPLVDIAFHCGYGSRQGFFESFKKSEGLAPSDYRKKISAEKYSKYKQTPYNEIY